MKVRKKPVVVDAMRYTGDNFLDVMKWAEGLAGPKGWSVSSRQLTIDTLEGSMCADVGDWIICGVKQEFYPCKPDVFERTYELV